MSNHETKAIIEDDKLCVHTIFHDDAALERNKVIKNENILEKGKLGIHQNEDIRFVISCPSVFQWNLFKRNFSDIYEALTTGVESVRMSAAKKIQLLHPEWVVFERL